MLDVDPSICILNKKTVMLNEIYLTPPGNNDTFLY